MRRDGLKREERFPYREQVVAGELFLKGFSVGGCGLRGGLLRRGKASVIKAIHVWGPVISLCAPRRAPFERGSPCYFLSLSLTRVGSSERSSACSS